MATPNRSTAAAAALGVCLAQSVFAQGATAPRAFVAAPDVYKVVAEGPQHRVLAVTLKPGERTPSHSHPASTAIYFVTDCGLKITESGVEFDTYPSAGSAQFMGVVTGHSALNVGKADCKMVYFEPK